MFIFRSVRYWLTLLFLVLTAAGSAAAWLYVVPPLRDRLVTQKTRDLLNSSDLILNSLNTKDFSITADGQIVINVRFSTQTRAVDERLGARVVIVDVRSGQIVSDTRLGQRFSLKDFPMFRRAVKSMRARAGIAEHGGGQYAEVVAPFEIPVDEQTSAVGAVLISAPLRDVNSAVSLVTRQILLSTLLAVAITLVCGYMAAYLIGRRLKSIERSAEAVAGGDFSVTVPVRGEDEIGQLAQTFNAMGERLEDAFTEVEDEKRNAETLLDTLSEGVIAVTADGRVARANPAAAAFFGRQLQPGAGIDDAFPEEVARLWHEVHQDSAKADADDEEYTAGDMEALAASLEEDRQVVFEMGKATLEAFTYSAGHGRDFDSIVVVRDVTQQARVERARRNFVANASHEFKTPLFSLSGFLELLDEEGLDPAEREEFLRLMKEQVERLQGLSLSLLDLSQMDAGAVPVHIRPVDPLVVARSVLGEFQARAAEKDLTLSAARGHDNIKVLCDEERLAQVLRALVDNATKFTEQGGHVEVMLERSRADGAVRIVVLDDGPGITDDDLSRVFDRFYRGSNTRGSKTGTGLGLSIARDLAALMGGALSAESHAGGGARFVLTLPPAPPIRMAPPSGAESDSPPSWPHEGEAAEIEAAAPDGARDDGRADDDLPAAAEAAPAAAASRRSGTRPWHRRKRAQ